MSRSRWGRWVRRLGKGQEARCQGRWTRLVSQLASLVLEYSALTLASLGPAEGGGSRPSTAPSSTRFGRVAAELEQASEAVRDLSGEVRVWSRRVGELRDERGKSEMAGLSLHLTVTLLINLCGGSSDHEQAGGPVR